MILTANDKHRFLAYVFNKSLDECWEWLGSILRGGYGHFSLSGKTFQAHRVAYYLEYGIDPGELFVCHHCDNPLCCNPRHLFLGTQYDNQQDASRKGRSKGRNQCGEKHSQARLTENNVIEIKCLLCLGLPQIDIARKFNITRSMVTQINTGKRWSHIQ